MYLAREEVLNTCNSANARPAPQELREQLEAIGEATLLPPTESEKRAPKFPSQGEVVQFMQVRGRGRGGAARRGMAGRGGRAQCRACRWGRRQGRCAAVWGGEQGTGVEKQRRGCWP